MKIIKKDVPHLAGFLVSTSLACIAMGITNPAVMTVIGGVGSSLASVIGGIGSSLAANFIGKFTPAKIKRWFVDAHPNDLNHHIKKLFIESIKEATGKILVLFAETQASDDEKKAAKQLVNILQEHLPKILLTGSQIRLEEPEIKHFLYEKDKEDDICNFIKNEFDSFGIKDPFKSFLAQNLPTQIQLCFGEGLKDPDNQHVWVAFQRMLMEEIRNDIKQIADTQQSIKDDLSDLKFEKSGLSEEQIAEIGELIKILNDKKLVEVKITSALNKNIASLEKKADEIKKKTEEIIRIAKETSNTVQKIKGDVKGLSRRMMIFLSILAALLLSVGGLVVYKVVYSPFTATIQVVDWKGSTNEWVNEMIYQNNGKITILNKEYQSIANGKIITIDNPAKYNDKKVKVYFESENDNFYIKDTLITLYKEKIKPSELKIGVRALESIHGYIIEENTGIGIDNALVFISGNDHIRAYTNKSGYYMINILEQYQDTTQTIIIQKENYKSEEKTVTKDEFLNKKDIDIELRPIK